jgi:trehalose/maltose transport system substrate-binding protein
LLGFAPQSGEYLRQDALNDFTRRTGIAVDLIPTWGTSAEQVALILRTLKHHAPAPDVYLIDMIWIGTLARHLMDLTPYLDENAGDHFPEMLGTEPGGRRLIGLPFYMNVAALYYRKDLLQKYGFRHPPTTWKELETAAAWIQARERASGNTGFWGYVWQGAPYEGLTCNALEWQMSFGGGSVIDPDGTISVNNPRAAQAFRRAAGWVGSISPPSVLTYTEADSLNAFRSGKAAFMRHWSSVYSADRTTGLTGLPAGTHKAVETVGGFLLAVSRYSAHPAESARLVLYLTGREVQFRRALRRGYLPTLDPLYSNTDLERTLPQLRLLKSLPPGSCVQRPSMIASEKYAGVSKAYYTVVHSILSHEAEPADALSRLERQLVDLTGFPTVAQAEHR